MISRIVLQSALAALLVPSIAVAQSATVNAWFDGTGLNPQSGVATQGVEGGDLGLTCDTSTGAAICQWRINLRFHNLEQLASLGTDLLGETSQLAISDVTHGDFPGPGYVGQGHNYQTPNAGGTLAVLKALSVPFDSNSQYILEQGAPGFYQALSFTLTATKPGGDQGLELIDARVNELLWAHVSPGPTAPLAVVAFGNAPAVPGNIEGGIASGVISIQSVPEPATAGMIVAGLVALLRRRRRAL